MGACSASSVSHFFSEKTFLTKCKWEKTIDMYRLLPAQVNRGKRVVVILAGRLGIYFVKFYRHSIKIILEPVIRTYEYYNQPSILSFHLYS